MSDKEDKQREADAELEREIRKGRKFTMAEAIGRMAGPGAMKGVSPVTRTQQAAVEIENWLRHHMAAGDAELQVVLLRRIKASELLLHDFEQPLSVLAAFCRRVLDSDYLSKQLAHEADVEWGRARREAVLRARRIVSAPRRSLHFRVRPQDVDWTHRATGRERVNSNSK